MKNYYSFNCELANEDNQRTYCFLFKSPGILLPGDLADAIEVSARQVLAPDAIAIVCIREELDNLVKNITSLAELNKAMERLTTRISLCICFIENTGKINHFKNLKNANPLDKLLLNSKSDIIFEFGLEKLFKSHHVLVKAPPGFTFLKPSGKRSTEFLRPEDALNEIENVQFLTFALLSKINAREVALGKSLEVIYIDTMAIASVAYALRELYCALYNAPRPRVVSFHSHDGLKDTDFAIPGTSFCIISASSSMQLEKMWREKSYCHYTEAITLITLRTATDSKRALYAFENADSENVDIDNLRDIRMSGERFVPEELKPKKVLLGKEAHFLQSANDFSKLFTAQGILSIQGRGNIPSMNLRSLYVDGAALNKNAEFRKFLQKTLNQKVPASLRAIVYQNDVASKELAEHCALQLKSILRTTSALPVISHNNIATSSTAIEREGGLLIVGSVIGRGTKLLAISRDLRALHIGARTYIVGTQVSDTQAQITALSRNLKFSAEKAAIEVAIFSSIAIGNTMHASYKLESEALSSLSPSLINGRLPERLQHTNGTPAGLLDNALLPSGSELEIDLSLRPDFAYWNFKYDEKEQHTPAVLMTVAAMLQNARESKTMQSFNRLGTDAFQQVILDPENFARYNDGVIQAALLRASYPSELDYSSEIEASRYLTDMLIKIFTQSDRHQGEGATEFAMAIYTKRLKLCSNDMERLLKHAAETLIKDNPLHKLLRSLLALEESEKGEQLPADF